MKEEEKEEKKNVQRTHIRQQVRTRRKCVGDDY
jgi:hypothetical protein